MGEQWTVGQFGEMRARARINLHQIKFGRFSREREGTILLIWRKALWCVVKSSSVCTCYSSIRGVDDSPPGIAGWPPCACSSSTCTSKFECRFDERRLKVTGKREEESLEERLELVLLADQALL